ncbi:MAG: SpaH/EbpB family LPXTG-anchored major pilin [Clostridium sp.]|nr:SpaH/EbpB family LPXTG-anchored major pilin [Clostridium sp.]
MSKNKTLRAILALFAAVLIACTALVPAFAAALPDSTGSLTIHKYLMGDVSKAGDPNDGTTITKLPDGATPLNGITFKLYKITLPSSGESPVDGDYAWDNYTNPTKLTSGGIDFTLTPAATPSITTTGGTDEAPLGVATASNLPQGLYFVVEQPNAAVVSPAAPFVVAVPMTNADGDGWIKDVHVYPKNEDVTIVKEVKDPSVDIGQTQEYTITVSVPTDIAAFKKFNIVDVLDPAQSFLNNAAFKVIGTARDSAQTYEFTAGTSEDYTVTLPSDGNSNTLTVAFNLSTMSEQNLANLAKCKELAITFQVTVKEGILDNVDNTIKNTAKVEFTNRFSEDKERESNETKYHTGSVEINKVDANTAKGDSVNGAQFQIAASYEDAVAGRFIKRDDDNGIVRSGAANYSTANDWIETATGGTEDKPAKAVFAGLETYQIDSSDATVYNSYWLVEVQAPDGYNLLAAPVQVTFTANDLTDAKAYTLDVTIQNTTDFTLPKTGGMGTILFTAGGIALVGAAIVIFFVGMKKKKNK